MACTHSIFHSRFQDRHHGRSNPLSYTIQGAPRRAAGIPGPRIDQAVSPCVTRTCRSLRAAAVAEKSVIPQAHPKLAAPAAGELREKHKIFDQATIFCQSGRGGDGEIAAEGKGRWVNNHKYRHNSGLKKQIWLPASEPADGQNGSDVVILADPSVDSLLHLHERKKWVSKRGANGNPAEGTGGPKRRRATQDSAPALKVPVPMGTVVKDKKGNLLAELIQPGDGYCICRGGDGGRGTLIPSAKRLQPTTKREAKLEADGIEVLEVEDTNWKLGAKGGDGETCTVTLQLRVVADAGIVGLPNVGKSTLLRRMTRSNATVANYPFTTLMPNLGVMTTDEFSRDALQQNVLVDLPGLIQGAHQGRGLGRMFLRHLARTQMLVHVLDGAAEDPAADYWVVREELRMFNAAYCQRPCVVAINKMDLPDAHELREELVHEVWAMAENLEKEHPGVHSQPLDVLCCSAETGEAVDELSGSIRSVLQGDQQADGDDDVLDWDTSLPETHPDSSARF